MVAACQHLVASLLVGLDEVADSAYRMRANTYYLGKFYGLDDVARRYVVVASLAHQPLDNMTKK